MKIVPPRNDAMRAWERSPERMLYDADFFNGWSLRPVGGLPLRVIASEAKQSRHAVLENFCLVCFVVPPRNDAMRAWERSPERMLYDADFFNGWSLRPVGGLPLCVIASEAKQSRHAVLGNSRLVCFVVPPRNDAKRAWERSPEKWMLNDADFFNGWSIRPAGGLPLCVIASEAKQSRHEVIKEIVILETY